jgi:hypothetical protein
MRHAAGAEMSFVFTQPGKDGIAVHNLLIA